MPTKSDAPVPAVDPATDPSATPAPAPAPAPAAVPSEQERGVTMIARKSKTTWKAANGVSLDIVTH